MNAELPQADPSMAGPATAAGCAERMTIKAPIPARVRVQRYRAKLRSQHYRRVEVWIERSMVSDLRVLAGYRRVPLRRLVREAMHAMLASYGGVFAVMKKYRQPV